MKRNEYAFENGVFGNRIVPVCETPQYDSLAHDFMKYDTTSQRISRDILFAHLGKKDLYHKVVLDLGCGYGLDAAAFAKQGAQVHGVDQSRAFLRLARKRCPTGAFRQADFSWMPQYSDAFFDTISSRYALQHAADLDPVFIETARVLKPGGKFVFVVTHPLRQYFEKPTRDYEQQEVCASRIFDGRMIVSEPSHKFSDYFSPVALNNFTLEKVIEKVDPNSQRVEGAGIYPGVLFVQYRRNDRVESIFDWSNTLLMLRRAMAERTKLFWDNYP